MQSVAETDYKVLTALAELQEATAIDELAPRIGLDQAQVTAVCLTRADQGDITVDERTWPELRLGSKAKALTGGALPERSIIEALDKAGGQSTLGELPALCGLAQKEVGQSLRWLQQKGWADKQGPALTLLPGGKQALAQGPDADEQLIAALRRPCRACLVAMVLHDPKTPAY